MRKAWGYLLVFYFSEMNSLKWTCGVRVDGYFKPLATCLPNCAPGSWCRWQMGTCLAISFPVWCAMTWKHVFYLGGKTATSYCFNLTSRVDV